LSHTFSHRRISKGFLHMLALDGINITMILFFGRLVKLLMGGAMGGGIVMQKRIN